MQIHELNTYDGTPDGSTYLALDDGSETSKVPATDIYPAMTQSQITSGVNTVKRVLTAAVLKPAIIAVAKTITDKWVDMTTPKINLDTSAASGDDYDLTQSLTSLGWITDVVTNGVLEAKKLLNRVLRRIPRNGVKQFAGTYTIGSSGYVQLGELMADVLVVSAVISTWSSNTGAFSLILSGTHAYLAGTPNVQVVNPSVKYQYIPL